MQVTHKWKWQWYIKISIFSFLLLSHNFWWREGNYYYFLLCLWSLKTFRWKCCSAPNCPYSKDPGWQSSLCREHSHLSRQRERPEVTWSFLLTYHWPKQVTWPCLQPMGLRNITLDQEGAGNILIVSSLVMQRLFCFQPTPCPGVRRHFCTAASFSCAHSSPRRLPSIFCPGLCSHATLLVRPSLTTSFPSLLLYGFPYFQTVQSKPICLFMYMFTCTHVHTHSEVNTEKDNTNKMMKPGDSINLSADLNIFRIKTWEEN